MSISARQLATVTEALAVHGMMPRGGFIFEVNSNPPPARSGNPARSIVLVGQAGAGPWPHFKAWLASQAKTPQNPLDTWSREVICAAAEEVLARAVFPSDKPYLPFQQWAARAEGLKPSPLGILIHPEYGLWHASRGALLFDEIIDASPAHSATHPCKSCVEKPCLSTCPVSAFSLSGYDVPVCVDHVAGDKGNVCRQQGCMARNACPVGVAYRYPPDVQAFHMTAFLANHPAKPPAK